MAQYVPSWSLLKLLYITIFYIKIYKTEFTSVYWKHCSDLFVGGKDSCGNQKCDCSSEPETGCMFGICMCTLEGHLSFNEISCTDENHPKILRNKSEHELGCPRACLANRFNTCPGLALKDDGRCYCPDGTLAKPVFTKDHRINITASKELCFQPSTTTNNNMIVNKSTKVSITASREDLDPSEYWGHCPDIFIGGKEKCNNEKCDCARERETGCMFGICVCTLQSHLSFNGLRCSNENHPNILRNKSHGELDCPRTCLANKYNSCPGAKLGDDGKCYCLDGTLVKPLFTTDHRINLTATKEFCYQHGSTINVVRFLPLGIIISTVVCIFGICVGCWKFKSLGRARKSSYNACQTAATNAGMNLLPATRQVDNPLYFSVEHFFRLNPELSYLLKEPLIANERISKEKRIGKGQFGEVFKGTYTSQSGKKNIAIKIPKTTMRADGPSYELEMMKSFYEEALITLRFQHKNILSCFGISTGLLGEPWLIVEYVLYGDLAALLRANSGVFSPQRTDLPVLRTIDLLLIVEQVASGMSYLAKQRFTHRDLAARNCLVGEGLVIKISDFGLTRDVYSNEYWAANETERMLPLPIRWMAPESITTHRFTTQTDVWSYGVLLWEIFTFGKMPHYLMSNLEVMEGVAQGLHPTPPEGCPVVISSLMLSCWEYLPDVRITFDEIVETLSRIDHQFLLSNEDLPGDLETVYAVILADT